MKSLLRPWTAITRFVPGPRGFAAALLLGALCLLPAAWAQVSSQKVSQIKIDHVGPASVSDDLIRANIRVKVGDPYSPTAVREDIVNLYATGLFYHLRAAETNTAEGVVLTYIVQAKPRVTDIRFKGNRKFNDAKLRKKLTSKVGDPLDEQKLFSDSRAIQELYQKSGIPRTEVNGIFNLDEQAGKATINFEVTERPKIKLAEAGL